MRLSIALTALIITIACSSDPVPAFNDHLSPGTWGGENAGIIVDDTVAHVHVGCTFGNFPGPVAIDADGHLNAAGSYLLKAYPIEIGPSMPAQLQGVIDGNKFTFSVVVNDTIEKKTTTLGPATVYFGKEPRMGPCPICRKPRGLT
jgi:hypothetical protein